MGAAQQSPEGAGASRSEARQGELQLVDALRAGDEAAFALLIDTYHTSLVRLATVYVSDRAVAEEVAQETWLGVLEGIRRFEGRSSLKTWIFRILVNRARTRAVREGRTVAFSALSDPDSEPYEPSVEARRFNPADHARWPGHWSSPPNDWGETPELVLLAGETRDYINRSIAALSPSQQAVITLHDIDGLTSGEVCNVLSITETNQRVLLHRARSKVRQALERYMSYDHES